MYVVSLSGMSAESIGERSVCRRNQRVVAHASLLEPPLGGRRVEIAQVLRFRDRMTRRLDPDVRPPALVVLADAEQIADHAPAAQRDRAGGML